MHKILCCVFILFNISIYGIDDLNIKLNKGEKEWIKKNKNADITIYLDKNRGILNYHSNGQRKGIFPNVMKLLEKKTGLKFNIVDEETEIFERSVDLGIPDIVMGVEDYKRNDKKYYYIDQPIELDGVMITRKNYPSIDFKEDNFGKTIVYEKCDLLKNKIIKKYGSQITLISRPNPKEAVKAILSKKADIYIEDYQEALRYIVENPKDDIKINYLSKTLKTDYYIGGKPEYQQLLSIIRKIINHSDISMKFFYEESLDYTRDKLEISKQLKKYIADKKKIRISIPFFEEFPQLYYLNDKKNATGFLSDYFYEINRILGLKVEFESKNIASDTDINPFILSVNGNELIPKTKKILITEPYTQIPLLIFNRNDKDYIPYFDNLKKYHIGVVRDSFIEKYLFHRGLKSNLIRLKNIEDVLKAVNSGKADILIGNLQQINYFSELYNINKLQVAGTIPDKIELSFGIPEKDPILYYLINSLNNEFSYRIKNEQNKFFSKKIITVKDYKLSMIITITFILLLTLVYNHLKKFKKISVKLKKLTIGLVKTLKNANTFNDEDTGDHIKRIGKYSKFLAKELQLDSIFIEEIELYASLHDLGKIGIPDNILKKQGKLTENEFKIMKNHVEIGYNMMKDLDISPAALNIIRYHHEKWNGTGYGLGLQGEEIPVEARIVALADVYDALRQKRIYKDAFTHEKSVKIIISESGKHFDPNLVKIFIKKHKIFEKIFEKSKFESFE